MSTHYMRAFFVAALASAALLYSGVTASGEGTERALWNFDEIGINPSVVADSTGLGHTGVGYGGVVGNGAEYVFDGIDDRVIVPDAADLDPGATNFSFGATLSMLGPPADGETYDILRKGLASTPGGNYKLEVKGVSGHARARCVVKDGTRHIAAVLAPTNLEGGAPHTVTCVRVGNTVTVQVDTNTAKARTVSLLQSVSNTANVAMGAKAESTASTGFDWYAGNLYDAYIRIG